MHSNYGRTRQLNARRPWNAATGLLTCIAALALTLTSVPARSDTLSAQAMQALTSGKAVAIMRHALAPGVGDPTDFDVNDCATQRNLSQQGRQQAQRIGASLRSQGVDQAESFSSAWCRCIDTATALAYGDVTVLESLNSFFQDRRTADAQTEALQAWIKRRLAQPASLPAVLVTHQVNISALTGRGVSSGELLVITLDDAGIQVLGSLSITP